MNKIVRQTRVMETETIEKNEARLKEHRSCGKFLLLGVFLFVFCGFTNKAVAWTGSGTATDPWLIGDGQTNTASAVKATISGNTLTISGAGNMADFWNSTEGEAPWNYHYYNNSASITNVVIQNSVTNIGNRAFHDLINLQTITIPYSVTIIGRESFFMEHVTNTNFQSVTIPNSVMEIEGEAFKGCSNLKTVTIENGTTGLNFSSFYYTGSEYSLGTKTDWFYGCPLQTLHFGRTLSSSSYNPFSGTSIQTLTIGNTVTSLGSNAFAGCSVLANVTLEDGAAPLSFNNYSTQFSNCPIKTFYWGRNLVQYGSPCAGITTLTSVTIGNNVNSIGSSDFYNCTSLASINIPSSITSIGDNAFYYCSSLKSITLPGSIASIGNYAFQYSGLTSISIPNSVTSLNYGAFSDCTSLTDVTLEDGTAPLSFNSNSYQFNNCPIKTFYWGRNLIQYRYSPCAGITTLSTLAIGSNITSLGNSDFSGCSGLTQITSKATTPPTLQTNTFNNVNRSINVIVPCDCLNAYKTNQYWNTFTNMNDGGCTTGIEDVSANQLSIYPNPAKSDIYINSEMPIKKVEIYSLAGALLLSDNNFTGKIAVSSLLKGIYLVKTYTDEGITVSKIVKE